MPVEAEPRGEILDHPGDRAVQPLPPGIGPGARVLVRGRLWRLTTCDSHEDCEELHLESAEGDDAVSVLWPFDRPVANRRQPRWRVVRPRAWPRCVRFGAAEDRDAIHLLEGTDGQRAVLPYQLVPALAMAAGARRVLLADEVGLGKTAQAGWIISDTLARQRDARILIAVPAGVRLQWLHELARLFAIDATGVDAVSLLHAVSALPPDINVWTPPGVYVVSLDFLKRPDITTSARGVIWDLLVVDEAHVAAAPTERHRAIDGIARRSRALVLVTATPFSGDDSSFASLMALGGADGSAPTVMFRRSRADVGDRRRRRHRFVRVGLTAAEQRLQRLLDRYCRDVWTQAPSAAGRLAAIVLRKRALSSPFALARSLRRRHQLLSMAAGAPVQLTLFGADVEDEDGEPAGVLGAPGMPDASRERRWLQQLIDAADRTSARNSKLDYLKRMLRRVRGESAVVFTEFRDTLADLAESFPSALRIHGAMSSSERHDVQARFNADGGLLFATDAAAHGLNLHQKCRLVINFELPWNPARLEQRIGRVDRIGQTQIVHAATLVARDTAEDVVIANLARRLSRVAGTLGARDRLAAFLDDARIAGMVIGDEPVLAQEPPDAAGAQQVPDEAVAEADRLVKCDGLARPQSDVIVSSLRMTPRLPAGFVVIARWTWRDPSGRSIACRTLPLHVTATPARPSGAADAKRIAERFIRTNGARLRDRMYAELRTVRNACRAAHLQAVRSQIDREIEIQADELPSHSLQPGLFDRRAWREAAADGSAGDDLRAETTRRINRLRASTSAEQDEDVEIRAVLIVWNH